jgi:hypothetical protein
MSKTYMSSSVAHFNGLFGFNKDNAPSHVSKLVDMVQESIYILHEINANENTNFIPNRKEFIVNTISDLFYMFDRYGYETNIGDVQVDATTDYRYQVVTVKSSNEAPEWSLEDVGSDDFAAEYESVVGMPIDGTPNAIAWKFYQKALEFKGTIDSMRKNKGTAVTAVIVWGYKAGKATSESDQWLFKVSDQTIPQICASFKAFLNPALEK